MDVAIDRRGSDVCSQLHWCLSRGVCLHLPLCLNVDARVGAEQPSGTEGGNRREETGLLTWLNWYFLDTVVKLVF